MPIKMKWKINDFSCQKKEGNEKLNGKQNKKNGEEMGIHSFWGW